MQALYTNIAFGIQAYALFPTAYMLPIFAMAGVLPILGIIAGQFTNLLTRR